MKFYISKNENESTVRMVSNRTFGKYGIVLLLAGIYLFTLVGGIDILTSTSFHWSVYAVFGLFNLIFILGLSCFCLLLLAYSESLVINNKGLLCSKNFLFFKKKDLIERNSDLIVEKWQSNFFRGIYFNPSFLGLGTWKVRLIIKNKVVFTFDYLTLEQSEQVVNILIREGKCNS